MSVIRIHLEMLSAGYRGVPVLEGLTSSFRQGEMIALIGPNGAGKSTLLKTIAGDLAPVSGDVLIHAPSADGGGDLVLNPAAGKDRPELARRMAVVMTDRIRPELMTCREIAAAGRYPYTGRMGMLSAGDEEKVAEALRMVHADGIADRHFSEVSDGQRQRVLLARALCQEPEIVVLDEPTSFLDIRHKLEFLHILRELCRGRRMTVVMSMHEIDLAQKVADRILAIGEDGSIFFGPPEEIFREEEIRRLFGLEKGAFDPLFGGIELSGPAGEPKIMVISAAGTGIPVFRKLQKEGLSFTAGILYDNDIDFALASRLAASVISERAFCAISDETYGKAVLAVDRAEAVLDAGAAIGECNRRLADLLAYAEEKGKLRKVTTNVWESFRDIAGYSVGGSVRP